MSQVDMVNHPPHYAKLPPGIYKECIQFTRDMPFSQGNAFKYIYRLGNKVDNTEDLAKAKFYVKDALAFGPITVLNEVEHLSYIEESTQRGLILYTIASGNMVQAEILLDNIVSFDDLDTLT